MFSYYTFRLYYCLRIQLEIVSSTLGEIVNSVVSPLLFLNKNYQNLLFLIFLIEKFST